MELENFYDTVERFCDAVDELDIDRAEEIVDEVRNSPYVEQFRRTLREWDIADGFTTYESSFDHILESITE